MDATNLWAWKRSPFRILMVRPDGWVEVDGIEFNDAPLGIHAVHIHSLDVTHTLSGLRVAGFTTLGSAMEFVHRVAFLINWTENPLIISPAATEAIEAVRVAVDASSFRPRNV